MTDTTVSTDPAIIIPKESALAVLTDKDQFDAFEKKIRDEVAQHAPDLTTSDGRKAIAALAFRVTKSKTAIVAAADELTEDARKQVKTVNESKKLIAERLDALRDEVRKPLTDWEAAKEAREARADAGIAYLREAAIVPFDATSADVGAAVEKLSEFQIAEAEYGDKVEIARNLRDIALRALVEASQRIERAEAEAAELAALRAEREERIARDQREADEREAEEARQFELARQEQARLQAEQDERDRIAREEQEAREVEQEAERQRIAAEEQRERDRIAAEERAAREKAEAEADELREKEAARVAEQEATDRRAKNREHKSKVMGEARDAIISVFPVAMHADEKHAFATAVVRAIAAGTIPNIEIKF